MSDLSNFLDHSSIVYPTLEKSLFFPDRLFFPIMDTKKDLTLSLFRLYCPYNNGGYMNIKTRPLTQAEFQTLIWNTPNPWRSVFMLAYSTGLRISDLLRLEKKPCPPVLYVKEKKTGNKVSFKVTPSIKEAWDYLANQPGDTWLLQNRDPSTYRKALVRYCRLAGIDTSRVAFHSIRKTTATTIYKSLGFLAANQYLGHVKQSTTLKYIELDQVEIGSILELKHHTQGLNHE